jgi:hypothetical protein
MTTNLRSSGLTLRTFVLVLFMCMPALQVEYEISKTYLSGSSAPPIKVGTL